MNLEQAAKLIAPADDTECIEAANADPTNYRNASVIDGPRNIAGSTAGKIYRMLITNDQCSL